MAWLDTGNELLFAQDSYIMRFTRTEPLQILNYVYLSWLYPESAWLLYGGMAYLACRQGIDYKIYQVDPVTLVMTQKYTGPYANTLLRYDKYFVYIDGSYVRRVDVTNGSVVSSQDSFLAASGAYDVGGLDDGRPIVQTSDGALYVGTYAADGSVSEWTQHGVERTVPDYYVTPDVYTHGGIVRVAAVPTSVLQRPSSHAAERDWVVDIEAYYPDAVRQVRR